MLATVSSVAQLAWCAASSRGHQRSSVALSGRKGSSGLISAARLVCCFLSVLSQSRLPICLLLRCNLVASSVHLLMTALPTGFVIVRRLPLRRPFRRTQTCSDAIQSQSSRHQVAIKSRNQKSQSSHTQVAIRSQSAVISVPHLRRRQAPLTHRQLVGRLLRQLALESCFPRRRKRRGGGVRLLERLVQQALLWGGERPSALVISGHQCAHQRRPSEKAITCACCCSTKRSELLWNSSSLTIFASFARYSLSLAILASSARYSASLAFLASSAAFSDSRRT